jgi:hypothetical protein
MSEISGATFGESEQRGVDVRPACLPVLKIHTDLIYLEADGVTFTLACQKDMSNEPRAIPGKRKGQGAKFYAWAKAQDFTGKTFREVVREAGAAGFDLHTFFAMD